MKVTFQMAMTCALAASTVAMAAGSEDAMGLWQTAEKDAVIRFQPCADRASALCGRIAWDKDAGTTKDTCGIEVARMERYENDAWREGWVYDPRSDKKYKGVARIKSGDLLIRAYVGVEILGQTEQLVRVAQLPATPVCNH